MSEEATDKELLLAWANGDTNAGDKLVRRHFSAVFRFLDGKISGPVDDLTQRTFTACMESAGRFRGDSSVRGFLLAIARRLLLDHLRRSYRAAKVFDPAVVSIGAMQDAYAQTPGSVLVEQQSHALLRAALRRIPLDFQMTIELYYWHDLPIAEVAEALDIAPGTVKSRLSRARDLLRAEIDRLAQSPELAQTSFEAIVERNK